jgi:ABC-type multidrug transport system fused ATPase/permease subunit
VPNLHTDVEGIEYHFGLTPLHVPRLINNSNSIITSTIDFNLPSPHVHPMFYVLIYSSIGLGTALFVVISNLVQLTGALKASRSLFKELLDNVVYATVRFHDTTPAGT